MNMDPPLFINTVILGGTTEQKLQAAHDAGFTQVELWRKDVEAATGGLANVRKSLDTLGLTLTDYQVLLDFDGAPDTTRSAKRIEALALLEDAAALGCGTLIVPANTRADCDADRVVEDLRWLTKEASRLGIRVAYEAMAWSHVHFDIRTAWSVVQKVDAPNLGMVVDAFHLFVQQRTTADLAAIPAESIYLVQLSDLGQDLQNEITPENLIEIARHKRLLPGDGKFPLHTLIETLIAKGYKGPIGIEVFNDAMKSAAPEETAARAMTALRSVLGSAWAA